MQEFSRFDGTQFKVVDNALQEYKRITNGSRHILISQSFHHRLLNALNDFIKEKSTEFRVAPLELKPHHAYYSRLLYSIKGRKRRETEYSTFISSCPRKLRDLDIDLVLSSMDSIINQFDDQRAFLSLFIISQVYDIFQESRNPIVQTARFKTLGNISSNVNPHSGKFYVLAVWAGFIGEFLQRQQPFECWKPLDILYTVSNSFMILQPVSEETCFLLFLKSGIRSILRSRL